MPVAALFDRRVANQVTLSNLLQRCGYASLDAVRDESREEAGRRALGRHRERAGRHVAQ